MGWRAVAKLCCVGVVLLLTGGPSSFAQFYDDMRYYRGEPAPGYAARPRTARPERQLYYYPGQVIPQGGYEPRPYGGQRPPSYGYAEPPSGYRRAPDAERRPVQPRQARRYEPETPKARRRAPVAAPAQPSASKAQEAVVEPSTHVVVFGDSFAELVGAGLEDAYEESQDIDVVRRIRADSGLARQDVYDWPRVVQEYLATNPKISYAVVMLGANDRQPIREGEISHEPLSERWREIYRDRVDAVVRAFADKKVPLVWVGMPPMRNERYSADLVTLNEIYRERVQKGGGIYVDIWPGFVNDENRYAATGPDLEGRSARLRTNDGVHLTQAGARKAAHFAETELKRLMEAKGGTAVATAAVQPAAAGAAARSIDIDRLIDAAMPELPEPPGLPSLSSRPLAGPTVPLTRAEVSPGGTLANGRPRLDGDAAYIVDRALRQGVAPGPRPGRADDFKWPRS